MKHALILALTMALTFSACCQNKQTQTADSMQNTVIETIMARRSIRAYLPQPVAREKMDLIAQCGINAPNGMNAQQWEVRIVDNPEFINGATAAYVESMKNDPYGAHITADPNFKNMFRNAPSLIFIAVKNGTFTKIDCGLMAENMLLAAHSLGVGSVCLGGPVNFFNAEAGAPFLERLQFSPEYQLALIIGFGTADEQPEAKPRDASKVRWVE